MVLTPYCVLRAHLSRAGCGPVVGSSGIMPTPCSLAQGLRHHSLSHLWLGKGSKTGSPWSLLIRRSTLSKKGPWSLLSPKLGLTSIYLKTQNLVTSRAKVRVVSRRTLQPNLITFLVNDIPSKPDFSFTYRPTPTTLFRFSALTFNGHHIHLDKDCTRIRDGYPGLCSDTAHVHKFTSSRTTRPWAFNCPDAARDGC